MEKTPTGLITIPASPHVDTIPSPINEWLDAAVAVWESGLTDHTNVVPASYTLAAHNRVLALAGVSGDAYSRKRLLIAWKTRETSSHWGQGHPATNYRMTEGGGDELGSMSYNQVWFAYRYSDNPLALHRDVGLNYYDPEENLKGFIIHTAGQATGDANSYGHTGAFYQLFDEGTLGRAYNNRELVGYRYCPTTGACGAVTAIGTNEDDYEKLARGIAAYNTSPGNQSWPVILRNTSHCTICAVNYSIDVRNSSAKFNLPYRQYIWQGGTYPADLTDASGNPDPRAGQAWCFGYGESEWLSGTTYAQARQNASDTNADGAPQTPIGRVNCN